MGYTDDHVRYVEHANGVTKPYFEQNFLPPTYIGKDGEANVDTISNTIEEAVARAKGLANDAYAKLGATQKFDPNKSTDPLNYASLPTNPKLQTVELPLISDVWNGTEAINYHCQIEVGSPPQTFYVDIDTGSSLFWLQSRLGDEDTEVLGQSWYEPSTSIAAIDLEKEDKAKYGDGDLVEVYLWQDQVTVGKKVISKAIVGAAPTRGVKMKFQMSKANGILGLGLPTDPANAGRKNLVQIMYEQDMVKHPSFALIGPRVDPKLAEKIDKSVIMQPRGTFVIGSVDPAYYTGSIAWCPQILATNRWVVRLDKILINGQVAFENQLALIDTGTAYIVASPSNFDSTQSFINGAAPLQSKGGNMFSYPADNLKKIGFIFSGREIRLQPQDFGLGGIKSQSGQMVSSIVKLPKWEFPENLWIIGGIFLDNTVTIFDYGERRVGFADISEKDLKEAGLMESSKPAAPIVEAGAPTAAVEAGATEGKEALAAGAGAAASAGAIEATPSSQLPSAESAQRTSGPIASDTDYVEVPQDSNAGYGREFSQLITLNKSPKPQIALGISSIDLDWHHVRLNVFATEISRDAFRLHMNASADETTHGVTATNSDSDTVMRGGKAAWLRALPEDPNIQTGRWSIGNPYPKGSQLAPDNKAAIKFLRAFDSKPKVILWISAMDFSKSVNWRLKADVIDVTTEGFTMNVGPWQDTILYKADISWIAHADIRGIQSGTFSTEDIRGPGWQLNNSGSTKFDTPFAKPPRVVAALNKIEFGYYRDLGVTTTTEITKDGINWSMNSSGSVHQYITRQSYIAFDPDSKTVAAAIS